VFGATEARSSRGCPRSASWGPKLQPQPLCAKLVVDLLDDQLLCFGLRHRVRRHGQPPRLKSVGSGYVQKVVSAKGSLAARWRARINPRATYFGNNLRVRRIRRWPSWGWATPGPGETRVPDPGFVAQWGALIHPQALSAPRTPTNTRNCCIAPSRDQAMRPWGSTSSPDTLRPLSMSLTRLFADDIERADQAMGLSSAASANSGGYRT
jgi:hypothetical protein